MSRWWKWQASNVTIIQIQENNIYKHQQPYNMRSEKVDVHGVSEIYNINNIIHTNLMSKIITNISITLEKAIASSFYQTTWKSRMTPI